MIDDPNTATEAPAAPEPAPEPAPAPAPEKSLVSILADNKAEDDKLAGRVALIENAISVFATRVDSLSARIADIEKTPGATSSGDFESVKSDIDTLRRRIFGD